MVHMIASRTLLAASLLALLCGACSHHKRAAKTVTSRSSFDLSCPHDQIELTVLATEGPRKLATQIGAAGCDQKAVYVYFASNDTWVANGTITPAMIQHEEDYRLERAREEQAAEQERQFQHQQSYQRGSSN